MSPMEDWKVYATSLFRRVGEFSKLSPDVMRGLQVIEKSPESTGKLDAKTHELIALAVAVTTRCDGCIARHTKLALDLGVTREEIAEALGTAIALNAGAALTYSARVFDAFDAHSKA